MCFSVSNTRFSNLYKTIEGLDPKLIILGDWIESLEKERFSTDDRLEMKRLDNRLILLKERQEKLNEQKLNQAVMPEVNFTSKVG